MRYVFVVKTHFDDIMYRNEHALTYRQFERKTVANLIERLCDLYSVPNKRPKILRAGRGNIDDDFRHSVPFLRLQNCLQ